MNKIAVVLLNLGGPDSKESIEPFLFNFFTDPNIIGLPGPVRWLFAKIFSKKRAKGEAAESYAELGYESPLLANSKAQAVELEKLLNKSNNGHKFKTFVCMRYWHPMAPEVIEALEEYNPDQIVLLPLYPQFSTTTVKSSFENFWAGVRENDGCVHSGWGNDIAVSAICCYPFNDGFVKASAENIMAQYQKARDDGHDNPRILFSAHGLPEKVIESGDPYQWQCEQTAERIVRALKIEKPDWAICYQSRVGPLKWIGPSLDEELERAAKDKVPVIVYPHAFTQEHVETLVELDIEYREEANKMGLSGYYRAETAGIHPAYIQGLADMIENHLNVNKVAAEGGRIICPPEYGRCCMRVSDIRL